MLKKLDLSENEEVTVKYEWVGVSNSSSGTLHRVLTFCSYQVYYILEDGPHPSVPAWPIAD